MTRVARPSIVLILGVAALAGEMSQSRVRAADTSVGPSASGAPIASPAPETMYQSAADLRLSVGFLRDQSR